MTPCVVITRPQEESEALAARVREKGYEALIEPMLTIAPLDATLPDLEPYPALAFTSANGVRAFERLTAVRRGRVYAVGRRTAAALRDAGFPDIRDGGGDALALARVIGADFPAGARVLHVAGRTVAHDLGALLAPQLFAVDRVAVYDAVPAETVSERLAEALSGRRIESVLLFSPRTARILGTLMTGFGFTHFYSAIAALCLSAAVGTEAACLPWARIAVARTPTADALLELLPRLSVPAPHASAPH